MSGMHVRRALTMTNIGANMRIIHQKYWGYWEVVDDSIGIIVSRGMFDTEAKAQAYIDRQEDYEIEQANLLNELEHNK